MLSCSVSVSDYRDCGNIFILLCFQGKLYAASLVPSLEMWASLDTSLGRGRSLCPGTAQRSGPFLTAFALDQGGR